MNVRLFVLGLLRRRPMHGYEMRKWLEQSRTDLWAEVLPGSIYFALKAMRRDGLVRVDRVEAQGRRSREVYAITEAGRAELLHLLQQALRAGPRSFPAALNAATVFADALPKGEVGSLLREAIRSLEATRKEWEAGAAARRAVGQFSPVVEASFMNGFAHIDADLAYLRALLAECGDP